MAWSTFRQIVLTTVSTILCLTPVAPERNFQAQLLKPMSLLGAFGLLEASFLILRFVPSLELIREDIVGSVKSRLAAEGRH